MSVQPSQFIKPEKKNIFVVDDHPLIRQGIAQLIASETDMTFAGEAGNAQEALQKIKQLNPDLVIADISLKGSSGIDLATTLLTLYPKILVLIISMHDESLYAERALKAGARGYLMKENAVTHVITAIRKILNGEIYISEKTKESFINNMVSGGKALPASSPKNLSNRELEVLQLLGQGLSTRQISALLHVSVKTIDSHYANIKLRLDLKNSHELMQYAVKWTLLA